MAAVNGPFNFPAERDWPWKKFLPPRYDVLDATVDPGSPGVVTFVIRCTPAEWLDPPYLDALGDAILPADAAVANRWEN